MNDHDFKQAAANLALYVRDRSKKSAADLGFSWFATERAPNTYPALVKAWERSTSTLTALPISSLNSDDTIFPSPIDNIHLRFYHDCSHMKYRLTFEASDEVELAKIHLDEAVDHMDKRTDEYMLLEADTLGQALMLRDAHRFAFDQTAFAKDYVAHGIDAAIALDIERARNAVARPHMWTWIPQCGVKQWCVHKSADAKTAWGPS